PLPELLESMILIAHISRFSVRPSLASDLALQPSGSWPVPLLIHSLQQRRCPSRPHASEQPSRGSIVSFGGRNRHVTATATRATDHDQHQAGRYAPCIIIARLHQMRTSSVGVNG